MIRGVASKMAWMARATTTVVGLAIMLALVLGVASTALGANGKPFILGKAANAATKVTGLVGNVADATQAALLVRNSGPGSALDLKVGSQSTSPEFKTVAPMKVDSQALVTNFNADELDGKDVGNIDPLAASIREDGTVVQGEGVVGQTSKIRTGVYAVKFNRWVNNCPRVVSIGKDISAYQDPDQEADPEIINVPTGQAISFNVSNVEDFQSKIGVTTRDDEGNLADKPFHLAVFC